MWTSVSPWLKAFSPFKQKFMSEKVLPPDEHLVEVKRVSPEHPPQPSIVLVNPILQMLSCLSNKPHSAISFAGSHLTRGTATPAPPARPPPIVICACQPISANAFVLVKTHSAIPFVGSRLTRGTILLSSLAGAGLRHGGGELRGAGDGGGVRRRGGRGRHPRQEVEVHQAVSARPSALHHTISKRVPAVLCRGLH